MSIPHYITIFIFMLLSLQIPAAPNVADEALIKSILVKKILDNTTWPQRNAAKTMSIAVYEYDSAMTKALTNTFVTSGNRDVRIVKTEKLSSVDNLCAVYIAQEYLYRLQENSSYCVANSILVITEEAKNDALSMINIKTVKSRLLVDVNHKLVKQAGLQVSNEVIIAVGNKQDIVNLYTQTADSIRTIKEELLTTERRLAMQQALYSEQQARLSTIENQLNEKIRDIALLNESIKRQKQEISRMTRELKLQHREYNAKLKSINLLEERITEYRSAIDSQRFKIAVQDSSLWLRQQKVLEYDSILESMQDSIVVQNSNIEQQNIKLERQGYINTIIFVIALSLASILLLAVLALRKIRKANNELSQKNTFIEQQKEELRIAFEQLKEVQSQLISSEKMASLGLLTAGIAHEINNPINYISSSVISLKLNFADIQQILEAYEGLENVREAAGIAAHIEGIRQLKNDLDYKILVAETTEMFGVIAEGAERTAAIVRSLRTFSRLDEDGLKQVDIHENIDNTLLLLNDKIKHSITVERMYSHDVPLLDCYSGPMNQVYMNILTNAIDAIESSGRQGILSIRTKMQASSDTVEIHFGDNGNGIDPATLEKIFDPFFTTKEVGRGTGLGLSITHNIIKKHKGTISVASTEGAGTTICITLPVKQA